MKVWVTRPEAYEVYMGGWRSVQMYIVKPFYDHRLKSSYGMVFEYGWYYGNHQPISYAKDFFKQDEELKLKIFDRILWSVNIYDDNEDDYHKLFEDRERELTCNINYKRMLLEVDLRTKTVNFVLPEVLYNDEDKNRVLTIDIPEELALHTSYPCKYDPNDDIPF